MSTHEQNGAATVPEFAEALRVHRCTVQRMIDAGEIHSIKIGKARRIPWSELSRLLERREVSTRGSAA